MGDLILMTRPPAPSRALISRALMRSGESAEILFFTGVRYYRMDDEVQPQTVIRRRRTARAAKEAAARRTKRVNERMTPASA